MVELVCDQEAPQAVHGHTQGTVQPGPSGGAAIARIARLEAACDGGDGALAVYHSHPMVELVCDPDVPSTIRGDACRQVQVGPVARSPVASKAGYAPADKGGHRVGAYDEPPDDVAVLFTDEEVSIGQEGQPPGFGHPGFGCGTLISC